MDIVNKKKYAVVEFIDESAVEPVPTTWLLGDESVLWPATYTNSQINRAVVNCESPDISWKEYPARVIANSCE